MNWLSRRQDHEQHPQILDLNVPRRLRPAPAPVIEMPEPRDPDMENPFTLAHEQLAKQWAEMRDERDEATARAERLHAENLRYAAELDRLREELKTRTAFFELEVERLTVRADNAVDGERGIRERLGLVSQTLQMVLQQEAPPPSRQTPVAPPAAPRTLETAHVPRSRPVGDGITDDAPAINAAQREETDESGVNITDLIDRIAGPVRLKQ